MFCGGYYKVVIKIGIVCYYNGVVIVVCFNIFMYNFKNFVQRFVFVDCVVIGIVWVNVVEGEGFWL